MSEKVDKYTKVVPDSAKAYAELKPITDAAQAKELDPWSPAVIDLLAKYGVNVERLKDIKAQANLSFPTSIIDHRSMAIGFRYAKEDDTFAEDLFVFVEDVALTCYYRGAQEKALPEYAGTHHAKIVLSEVLPDFQRKLADMQQQISSIQVSSAPELITDEMHLQAMREVADEFNDQVRSFAAAHGDSSAVQQFSMAAQREATKKRRALQAKKALSDRAYPTAPPPELSLQINGQANNNRFDVQLINKSTQTLVAKSILINGVKTEFDQQFTKLFPVPQVNAPEDIFDKETSPITVLVRYQTQDGKRYELTQNGEQELRADKRYNVIFPSSASIRSVPVGED